MHCSVLVSFSSLITRCLYENFVANIVLSMLLFFANIVILISSDSVCKESDVSLLLFANGL